MRTSDAGIALLKEHEGLRLKSYKDIAGVWTIGYGHTGPEVGPGQEITKEEAEELLVADLRLREAAVGRLIEVSLNQNEFDALVSFTYNLGVDALRRSTLRRRLNKNLRQETADQFLRWDKASTPTGLRPVLGLTRRREAERELFLKPFTK